MKRKKFSFKNFILWTLFYFNLFSFLLGACCMDSDYYIAIGSIMLLNMAYMALFYIVNYEHINKLIMEV